MASDTTTFASDAPAAAAKPDLSWYRRELNLRDLGGYPAADGRTIKHGLLFRSAALGEATPEELEGIRKLGLKHVLDLRCADEAEELPDPEIPGAHQLRLSGAIDADDNEVNLSPGSIYKLLVNPRRKDPDPEESIVAAIEEIYTSLAFDNPTYRHLMRQLEDGVAPVLFHCTAGKDRTGIGAMVILMALGVDEDTIVRDFVLTNEYRASIIEAKLAKHRILAKVDVIELAIRASEGVVESFGRRVLSEIKQEYGTIATYLEREFGLAGERLEALREKYLE